MQNILHALARPDGDIMKHFKSFTFMIECLKLTGAKNIDFEKSYKNIMFISSDLCIYFSIQL
jgi:hypothetical protein